MAGRQGIGGRVVKEGIVEFVVGRKVVLLNKITSYGWNGLVTVFSTVESQALSAKQTNTIYTVRMEEMEKVVGTMKPGRSSSELGVRQLDIAMRRDIKAPKHCRVVSYWVARRIFDTEVNEKVIAFRSKFFKVF